jgi:hypothetical protein
MKIVRTAALKISAKVVRYSSAGNKEWAAGLAREVDFIRSDWGALLWSLGSLRVLLDRRPAPIRTYDDLWPLVQKYVKAASQMKVFIFVAATQLLQSGSRFFESGSTVGRAGNAMMSVAWIISGIYAFVDWRTKKKLLAGKDLPELIGYYRDYLEKQVNWFWSSRWWMGLCTTLLVYPGIMLVSPHFRSGGYLDFLILCFFAILTFPLYARRNARRRLQELDALLGTEAA